MRHTDAPPAVSRASEFAPRVRLPTLAQFVIIFFVDFFIVCAAYYICTTFTQFALMCLVMLALTDTVMIWSVQRSRDQVLVTEFQNALYSAALSINSQFCIILRKDGTIMHTDVGFRAMYPQFQRMQHRMVDDIFQLAHLSKEEVERVYQMIASNTSGHQLVVMRDGDGLAHKIMLYVDPIRRPQDYVLLRGRSFVEYRLS